MCILVRFAATALAKSTQPFIEAMGILRQGTRLRDHVTNNQQHRSVPERVDPHVT